MIDRRLATLAFANFVVGTGTFIVAGLLNQLAEGLGVSLAAVGRSLRLCRDRALKRLTQPRSVSAITDLLPSCKDLIL